MTRTRIQKQRKTRKRTNEPLTDLAHKGQGRAAHLVESVEDLLDQIDHTLRETA